MRGTITILARVLGCAAMVLAGAVSAAEYPDRPIVVLCPYPPGASMDLMTRLVADISQKYTGQPMVVQNKPGAGGSLAAVELVNTRPDGYKLVTLTNLFFATTVKSQEITFDPNDIVPIAAFMELRNGLMVRADSQWKSLDDLLDYAKKNPGKLRWGHSGRGISLHMAAVAIIKKANVDTLEVPYKGSPDVLTALLGGHIDAGSLPYGTVIEHVKSGKGRFLTFYSDRRYGDQPNVPSAVELHFPDAGKLSTYVGLHVHKNTPESVKAYLVNVSKKIYDDPRFKIGIEQFGEEPKYGGPDFVRASIKEGAEVGVPILKETGLYVGK